MVLLLQSVAAAACFSRSSTRFPCSTIFPTSNRCYPSLCFRPNSSTKHVPSSQSLLRKPSHQHPLPPSITTLLDVSHPPSCFPSARSSSRTIIAHIGPTNSGKTRAALQALALRFPPFAQSYNRKPLTNLSQPQRHVLRPLAHACMGSLRNADLPPCAQMQLGHGTGFFHPSASFFIIS